MNHNIQQQLLDLEDEIKRYYNVGKWPAFKNNTEIDKTYLSIIKSIMKEHNIKMTNFRKYENSNNISCYIFENYNDIFKKLLKDELDLEIMSRLLAILKLIEDERVDQHEGSVLFGKILKELYVDSALKKCKKMDESQDETVEQPNYVQEKPISWSQWRTKRTEIKDKLEKLI